MQTTSAMARPSSKNFVQSCSMCRAIHAGPRRLVAAVTFALLHHPLGLRFERPDHTGLASNWKKGRRIAALPAIHADYRLT
jgi:hypothetical protein